MLSSQQIEAFRQHGVIILRAFYTPEEVRHWRAQVLDYVGHPTDADSWRDAMAACKGDSFQPEPDISPALHARLSGVYERLYGPAQWAGRTRLIVRAGRDQAEWRGPRLPHIDIPYNAPIRTLINNVTYLSKVEERGGAFIYWPGSHRIAWDYYREYPEDFMAEGERTYNQAYEAVTERMTSDPVEFVGEPGDVLIIHSLTLHSASVNKRDETRVAIFGQWGVETDLRRRHEFDRDMWEGWRIAEGDDASSGAGTGLAALATIAATVPPSAGANAC